MEFFASLLFGILPVLGHFEDPAYNMRLSSDERRNWNCEHMTQARGHERFPGRVPAPQPRATVLSRGYALICEPRVVAYDLREPRDEAILSNLSARVGAIVEAAEAHVGKTVNGAAPTWSVDAFYPEERVNAKLAAAARTGLAERGALVDNRVPMLAAGDLLVMRRLTPAQAFPLACARFFAEGSLDDDDAFLAIVLVDPRATELHAGVCFAGHWRWLS